jgi:hypothetical protein
VEGSELHESPWITFSFYSSVLYPMFPGPESSKRVVVHCKGCGENIPAPVETVPSQPVAARCPLCQEHGRYLPSEVFLPYCGEDEGMCLGATGGGRRDSVSGMDRGGSSETYQICRAQRGQGTF